jgi:putative transposase
MISVANLLEVTKVSITPPEAAAELVGVTDTFVFFRRLIPFDPEIRSMTPTRCIRPGSTWLVTRRCAGRQYLLRPDSFVNQTLLFFLAEAAKRFGIEIHAFQFLSNHYHILLTDPNGVLPDFVHRFNTLVAKALNHHLGREENFWSTERTSMVEIFNEDTFSEKLLYTLKNVVEAGLVHKHDAWPGLTSTIARIEGDEYVAKRPTDGYFANSSFEPEVRLKLTRPAFWKHRHIAKIHEEHERQLRGCEASIRAERRAMGREFLGRALVLAQDPFDRPKAEEPRAELVPEIACLDRERRIEEIRGRKEFREAYQKARKRFIEGARKVFFPFGTWLFRVRLGVNCEPSPA